MKVELPIGELRVVNHALRSVIPPKSEVEELQSIGMVIGKNSVSLWGTNLFLFARTNLRAKTSGKPEKFLFPFAEFSQLVPIWESNVLLTFSGSQVIMESGKDTVELTLQQGSRDFFGRFPRLESKRWMDIPRVPEMIASTNRIVDPNHEMAVLCGVHLLSEKNRFVVEAADGTRYLRYSLPVPKHGFPMDRVLESVSGSLFSSLPKDMPGKIGLTEGFVLYECPIGTFAVSEISNTGYPDLDALPLKKSAGMRILKKELELVLDKIHIFGTDRVVLEYEDGDVTARTLTLDDTKNWDGVLGAGVKGDFPKVAISVSHLKYFLSLCREDTVIIQFGSSEDPVWLREGSMTGLTMPFYISQED